MYFEIISSAVCAFKLKTAAIETAKNKKTFFINVDLIV
jgi:hypothetical protein